MDRDAKILAAIHKAIRELNRGLDDDRKIEASVDTALFGKHSHLDSYALVKLIAATEQQIEDLFGVTLTLADEQAVSRKGSPFSTVGSLAGYIGARLEAEGHD